MSCFIVNNSTISTIVSFLARHSSNLHFSCPTFIDPAKLHVESYRQSVGQRLLELNVASVNDRYRGNDVALYEAEPITSVSPVQAVKSIECYLYQSCECGHDKDETYTEMVDLLHAIAVAIVQAMPAYEDCNWG
jgi:hypothetical protein